MNYIGNGRWFSSEQGLDYRTSWLQRFLRTWGIENQRF